MGWQFLKFKQWSGSWRYHKSRPLLRMLWQLQSWQHQLSKPLLLATVDSPPLLEHPLADSPPLLGHLLADSPPLLEHPLEVSPPLLEHPLWKPLLLLSAPPWDILGWAQATGSHRLSFESIPCRLAASAESIDLNDQVWVLWLTAESIEF